MEYVDLKNDSDDYWHLPHFPVVQSDKSTTKVRIVFGRVARYNKKSLKDLNQQGPKT